MCVPPVQPWAQDLPVSALGSLQLFLLLHKRWQGWTSRKSFLGILNADCFKPKIIAALEVAGLHAQDVFVPEIEPGCLGIAFCTFLNEEESQRCITAFNGCSTVDLTPSAVQAGRTTTWEPFFGFIL